MIEVYVYNDTKEGEKRIEQFAGSTRYSYGLADLKAIVHWRLSIAIAIALLINYRVNTDHNVFTIVGYIA